MHVLGIGDHVSCGSCLAVDGRLAAAINDERLVREKMVFGVPRESIRTILDRYDLRPEDVGAIGIGTKNQHFINEYMDFRDGWFGLRRGKFKQALFEVASNISKYRAYLPFLDTIYYGLRQPAFRKRRRGLQRVLREEFGFTCPIRFLDHHFCHATSAYYTSGYQDALVLSIDGGGDAQSCRVYDVVDGHFEELVSISSFASLGTFYSYVTQICGFKAGRHEGKITGLAAYGDPIYMDQMQQILAFRDGTFHNVGNVFFLSALRELKRLLPDDFRHCDLAASIQTYAEKLVVNLVTHWKERTGRRNVALAGGVVANVKINQRVHEISGVESVFVHPGMADDGMPVGASLALSYENRNGQYQARPKEVMGHVYLGPDYTDAQIKAELDRKGLKATRPDNIEREIARLLSEDRVVARFDGRMEYGPRALGNRSILYQTQDPTVQYWLNDALGRTEFMPFAPVVMAEHAERCFVGMDGAVDTSRFMTITFDCTEWMAKHCPAVVHVDNTARPQLVSEEDNQSLYRVLSHYHEMTGIPCLINTSFNMHEEPIVCSPFDAIRAFQMGHLDYLAIGSWLVENPQPHKRIANQEKYQGALEARGVATDLI